MKKINTLVLLLFLSLGIFAQSLKYVQDITDKDISTTKALPKGMTLVWNDEFNGTELDTAKWWDRYYSSLDWFNDEAREAFENKTLPTADYSFTGKSIILKGTDKLYPGAKRQISSIQTYNWETNTNMMNNELGGYFEARIKRNVGKKGDKVNLAFWFDSPGPDLKYYLEKGGQAFATNGIRPRGQLFEIDMCEYITTEIVLHGNVDSKGKFERNIGHYIHKGDFKNKWVTHSMLWTPAGLKFYIDGEQIAEWWEPNNIKSPNHAMNMFFGAYGINDVTVEVDYVRHYQWQLEDKNYLPNASFEYSNLAFPWEGTGKVTHGDALSGQQALILNAGEYIEQLVYLDHSNRYWLEAWAKGGGLLAISVDNVEQVTAKSQGGSKVEVEVGKDYAKTRMYFETNEEPVDNKKTIRLKLKNAGANTIYLDNLKIEKAE